MTEEEKNEIESIAYDGVMNLAYWMATHPSSATIKLVLDTESEHYDELKKLSMEGSIGTDEYVGMIKKWIFEKNEKQE